MKRHYILAVAAASLLALAVAAGTLVVVMATRGNLPAGAFGGLLAFFVAGIVLGAAAWLMGLARAAGAGRWDWFVLVLALGPLGALIYGIIGADEPAVLFRSRRLG
jgi:hypothetical protein